jgi:hypothetical protein
MEIEFVLIADAVENVNGKLYVMGGGWTVFRSASFPAQIRFGIAVSIRVSWEETNAQHDVHIRVVQDPDRSQRPVANQEVMPLEIGSKVHVTRPPGLEEGSIQRVFLAVNGNLPIPHAGKYRVTALAGNRSKSVEFEARLVALG